jgi:hypothetical protein
MSCVADHMWDMQRGHPLLERLIASGCEPQNITRLVVVLPDDRTITEYVDERIERVKNASLA